MKPVLICPVCGLPLMPDPHTLRCEKNHCFDRSKYGYVNLLQKQKKPTFYILKISLVTQCLQAGMQRSHYKMARPSSMLLRLG